MLIIYYCSWIWEYYVILLIGRFSMDACIFFFSNKKCMERQNWSLPKLETDKMVNSVLPIKIGGCSRWT